MIVAYDSEARSREAFIKDALVKEEAGRKIIAEEKRALVEERDCYKKNAYDMGVHLQRANQEKKKADERSAELEEKNAKLEAELSTLKASRESDLAAARRTAAGEVQTKLGQAYELFRKMMKRPLTKMVHFSQAESNIELLDEMISAKETFDPAAERDFLIESKGELGKADEAFDTMSRELKEILGTNYIPNINVADLVASPRVEISAKSVGINAASGSNDGDMGLLLRNVSGGSSDNESDASDKTVDPAPPVATETQRELVPLEQDTRAGEVASSASKANQAEETAEEGELVADEGGDEEGDPVA